MSSHGRRDFSDEEHETTDDEISEEDSSSSGEDEHDDDNEDDDGPAFDAQSQGPSAEMEIEGDFKRLIENIRSTEGDPNANMLTKDWDFNIEERDALFHEDLRAASGVGRRKRKRGRYAGITLSHQVRALIGEGNQAYVDADIPEAMRVMQEVIRIEPRAAAAWLVLAKCHTDRGQPHKALQLRIMGAHLHHDAEEWDHLARESRELGFKQQALYCYGKVHSLDQTNINALWDRAALAKELGDNRVARNSLVAILKQVPHDLTILEELRPVLIDLHELALCASLFQNAFVHYSSTYPTGRGVHPETGADVPGGGFGLMELLVLGDLYNSLGEHDKAVHAIRSGCRWLQGRAQQKFWDACEDDREYDVGEWRAPLPGRDEEVVPGRYPLDVNARHRLAVARIKMHETDEGVMHANIVLSQDVLDYAPLFGEIADAYYEREMYAQAKPIYEILGHDAGTSSLYVLIQVARCCHMLGELHEAAEVYEHVISADDTQNEVKMSLAEIYEVLNEPRKALKLVYEVIDSRKRRPREAAESAQVSESHPVSLFEETARNKSKAAGKAQHRLTITQLRELEDQKEREMQQLYRRVQDLWPAMMRPVGAAGQELAEREWLLEAEKMIEAFRETRNLFLTVRNPFRGMFPARKRGKKPEVNEDDMVSRLQLDLEHDRAHRSRKDDGHADKVDIFRGVTFDEWLKVFMQYAFLLTKRGQYETAEEVLRHLMHSNAYQKAETQTTIRLTLIACAIFEKRHAVVVEQCRKLINNNQFNNEPFRLLTASLASGFRSTDLFITSTLQKHIFREIKLSDAAVKNKDNLRWNGPSRRWAFNVKGGDAEDAEDDRDEKDHEGTPEDSPSARITPMPTKNNPILVATYGQISIAAKSYQSAIFYLLHAYDYCPDDAMVCLSLAIACMGRAMQRQADNRHHLVAQAMAFLSRYRSLRRSDATGLDEIEFNFGRAFQQLGLHSLAVKHYERVLEMAENRQGMESEDVGLAREAAYNLSLIFVTTGAAPLAEQLYRRWLSL